MAATFVGRQSEVAALRDLCTDAERLGRPVVGVVTGDPGSGKSRLLAEVRTRLGDWPLVGLAGFEAETSVPMSSARHLLDHLAAMPGNRWLWDRGLLPTGEGDPALGRETSVLGPLQVFEAASEALLSHGPLTVVVDDLQWVDGLSLALLSYLVRAAEIGDRPLALLVASRTAQGGSFIDSVRRIVSAPARTVLVELGVLDDLAAAQIVNEVAPDLDEQAVMQIVRRAGGSPFWLETLASVPEGSIGSLVDSRISGADADSVFLLSALALAIEPLATEEIGDLRQWPLRHAQAVAAELVRRGLARQRWGAVMIVHDLMREAVTAKIPPATARSIHHRLAELFERQAGRDDSAADLPALMRAIDHRRSAGRPVLDLGLRVARSRGRRMLGTTELELLLAIAHDADRSDQQARELRSEIAGLAGELGQFELALRLWAVHCDESEDPAEQAQAALAASEAAVHLNRGHDAWTFWQRAQAATQLEPAIKVTVSVQQASMELWLEHRPDAAWDAARRAIDEAAELGTSSQPTGLTGQARRAYLRALLIATEAGLQEHRPAEVALLSEELARVAAGIDERTRLKALADGGLAMRWLGRGTDAEHTLRRAWQDSRRELLPQTTLEVGAIFTRVLYSSGKLAEAAAVLAECRDLGRRLGEFCPARPVSMVVTQLVEHSTGSWQHAADGLLDAAAEEDDPHSRQHAYLERASILARLDPRRSGPDVHSSVARARADATIAGCRRCLAETLIRSAEALARTNDVGLARDLLLEQNANVVAEDAMMALWAGQTDAVIAEATGNLDDAIDRRRTLITTADGMGLRMESLWLQLDLGTALSRVERMAAANVLRTAGATAEAIGGRTERLVADQALRALGVRTWRRGSAGSTQRGPVLTARERQVARLAAAGASNPEIAAALFLSRKTVERHLSNSLAKLGLRNRVELAAALGPDEANPREFTDD